MALPFDTTGVAPSNKITNEVHDVTLLKDRHFVPTYGTFFVRNLRIYNWATGKLLEPILQYNVLQQNTAAANETLKEVAQIINISDHNVKKVILEYQAVGGRYETVSAALQNELELFRTNKISSVIGGVIADEFITLPPREYLGNLHEHDRGSTLYKQLSNVAETIEAGDPAGQQMSYEYMVNYTQDTRKGIQSRLDGIKSDLDRLDLDTRIVNGQYIFTREELNPYIYLNYGTWVKNSNMLFRSAGATNPVFGTMTEVKRGYGLLALHVMAYQRDDSAIAIRYTITPDITSVDEGGSVTFTLSAPDVPVGTVLPYILSGVESYDIVGGLLTGNFTMGNNGLSTTTIQIAADGVTDGPKTLLIVLKTSPDVYANVLINDTSKLVVYSIWYSSDVVGDLRIDTVNEGQSVYLQIRSNDSTQSATLGLDYTNSSATSDDFLTPLPIVADLINGSATIKLDVRDDFSSEGNESLITGIYTSTDPSNVLVRASLLILDSSRLPTWTSAFYANASSATPIVSVNEGESFIYRITATNLSVAEPITLNYSGDAVPEDFTHVLPTSANLLNTQTFAYTVKADQITEGDKAFTITSTFDNPLISTPALVKSITLVDTSLGYAVTSFYLSSNAAGTAPVTSATVPTTVYTAIKTTGFANGEQVYVDYTDSDPKLIGMLGYTGRTTVVSNSYAYLTNTFNDPNGTITGSTPLRAKVYRAVNGQAEGVSLGSMSAAINPRLAPSATLTLCSMYDFNPISSVNEGSKFRLRVSTVNVPNGSPALTLTYSGTAGDEDFVGVRPNSVVVTDNVAIVEYTVKADRQAEGPETSTIKVGLPWSGGEVSATIQINDTSLPMVDISFTSDLAGNVVVTSVDEGSAVYMRARTVGYPDQTVLTMDYSGSTATTADFVGGLPTTMTIVGNIATAMLTTIADDQAEGNETLLVQARLDTELVTLSPVSLTVNDTSVPGPVRVFWSDSTDPNDPIGLPIFNETTNNSAYLHINSVNVPVGAIFNLTYEGTATAADFDNGLPATVISTGQWTRLLYKIKRDELMESGTNEYMNVTVRYNTRSKYNDYAMVIEDTSNITEVILTGIAGETVTYGNKTYKVQRSNLTTGGLWEYFRMRKGRYPTAGERVVFIAEEPYAILNYVGEELTFGTEWNIVGSIHMTIRGMIVGMGGQGAGDGAGDAVHGRPAIINKSSKTLFINNYGILGAGGGGGAAAVLPGQVWTSGGGGGGAPYGRGNKGPYDGPTGPTATFSAGGVPSYESRYSGTGGAIGMDGGKAYVYMNWNTQALPPGNTTQPVHGPVNITNIDGGQVLGK